MKSCMKVLTISDSLANCSTKIVRRRSLFRRSSAASKNMNNKCRRVSLGNKVPKNETQKTTSASSSGATSHGSSSARSSSQTIVTFSTVEIRTYKMALCEALSLASGPAIGLDWIYVKEDTVQTIDEYDGSSSKSTLSDDDLRIDGKERVQMLLRAGYSLNDIQQATWGGTKAWNEATMSFLASGKTFPKSWSSLKLKRKKRSATRPSL
jgi:hypothetical protein